MFQIEKISGSEFGFELSVSDLLKHGKRWHPDLISSVSDLNPSLVGELDIFYIQNPFSKVNTDLLGVKNWALLEMLNASTTHRRGRRFMSGEPKYIFTEHLQDGEREQPVLPSSMASSPFSQDVGGIRCAHANPFGGKASRLSPKSNSIYPIPHPQSSFLGRELLKADGARMR